ncbi:MAG: MBOAT family protein [Oscillospiraceae bacterium]|nr:MBOAT family protein [Oscillospiraceae bacterium]
MIFLYLFLPACLIAYYFCKSIKAKNIVLVAFSLLFYAWGEPVYVLLLLASVCVNYAAGQLLGLFDGRKRQQKWILTGAVVLNLGALVVFKYAGLLVETFNGLTGASLSVPQIALPIGISFFTFQAMTYVIDVYRGQVKVQKSLLRFMLYISMFPQLIAGPIVRYADIEGQLDVRCSSAEDVFQGLVRFSVGLGKKILLADHAYNVCKTLLDGGMGSATVVGTWFGVLMFMFQIYFDFSGYSDMAIGLGRIFGFRYLENFRLPYMSVSITDFWRRWHMSLGTFFRDYVYIPLGGNRKHQMLNLFVVWSLTGLWHGASWNFLLWGLYFFGILVLEKKYYAKYKKKVIKPVRRLVNLLLILIGWVIFYFTDLGELGKALAAMIGFAGGGFISTEAKIQLLNNLLLLIVCVIGVTPLPRILGDAFGLLCASPEPESVKKKIYVTVTYVFCLTVIVLSTISLVGSGFSAFLYYRF